MNRWVLGAILAATAAGGAAAGYVLGRGGADGAPAAVAAQGADGGPQAARAADAPRPGRDGPFRFERLRLDTGGDQPVACLEFSRPLSRAAGVRYADFVTLDPPARIAAAVEGEALCLRGLPFEPDRTATVRAGLPAADGTRLARDHTFDISFGQQPPFVGFPGPGAILPRTEADGLPISTINVTRLSVEVRQVSDRMLPRAAEIGAGGSQAEGSWTPWSYEAEADDLARPVFAGTVEVKAGQNERATTVFPLGAVLKDARPGVYVVRARDASPGAGARADADERASALRWVVFTDLALATYQGGDGLTVVARSLESARVAAGVRLTLAAANGDELASATTDGQGRARFAAPLLRGTGPLEARYVLAYGARGDFAAHDLRRPGLDLTGRDVGGRRAPAGEADAFVFTDRGVYRPGEIVRATVLLRDAAGKALGARTGALVVTRPNGSEALRLRVETTALGDAAAGVAIGRGAPRGRWTIALVLDGADEPAGAATVAVEDFTPQRLEVTVRPTAPAVTPATPVAYDVAARFLYGAPGAGLPVEGEARITVDPNPFPQLAGYAFGKAEEMFEERLIDLGRTTADGQGAARLALALDEPPVSTRPLRAETVIAVTEPGGRAVRERVATPLRAAPLWIGLKPRFEGATVPAGQEAAFDLVATDAAGRLVARPNLLVSVIEEDWDYDWYLEDGAWNWRRTSRDAPLTRQRAAAAAAGPVRIAQRLPDGWYRLLVQDEATGAATSVRFSVGWGGAGETDTPDAVLVAGPEAPVRPGQTARIAIKPPYAGEAQIVVATDRVIETRTLTVPAAGARVDLRVDERWGGGAYVMVSVVTPRTPASRPVPRRAVGVAYVAADQGARTLKVAIGGPQKVRPRQTVELPITVDGAGLAPVRYAVFAVDEGILRLTKFETPDPARHFFGKRALGVTLRDDYGRLIDPNMGAPAAFRAGGDSLGGEGLTVVPTKTVALATGVLDGGRGGARRVRLDIPDFNGELRLMAVAWTAEAMGAAGRALIVRDPVVAELALPRFLAPGDAATATLLLDNVEGRPGAYAARIAGTGALSGLPAAAVSRTLAAGERAILALPIAAAGAGAGGVTLTVTGPGFSVARAYPIETRSPFLPVTVADTAPQRPGERFTAGPALVAGFGAGTVASVSFSTTRGIDAPALLGALSRYPYGCTEQIVSVALPLVYRQTLAPAAPGERARRTVQDTVNRLLDRQSPDGAIGLWREGDGAATGWLGAYATDFLWRAKQAGAAVPDEAMAAAFDAMREVARLRDWSRVGYDLTTWEGPGSNDTAALARARAAAYALYVLARAKQTDLGPVRYHHDSRLRADPSPLARAHVGAALAALGDRARARNAFRLAEAAIGYANTGDWLQSPVRDMAGVVALATEAGELDVANRVAARLAREAPPTGALNTQEQAQMLLAARALAERAGPLRIAQGAAAPVDGRGAVSFPLTAAGLRAGQSYLNAGQGPVWRTVLRVGPPLAFPGATAQGLTLSKRIVSTSGAPVDPAALTQGERVVVLLSGAASLARPIPALLVDPLPAGLEIETVLRPADGAGADGARGAFAWAGRLTALDVAEARDDRFVAAFTATRDGFQAAYVARAVTPGAFALPAAQVEDMYRPGVLARTGAGRLGVRAPG